MKTTVLYHSADFDGIFCREIARHFLGDKDVEYIGWNFGDKSLYFPKEGLVYVMDLPLDKAFNWTPDELKSIAKDCLSRVIWIDHHASSIASHPTDIPGYRIDGVAACRLAWQWFQWKMAMEDYRRAKRPGTPTVPERPSALPEKNAFIARLVTEPLAVRIAGEYDIWDRKWMAEDENILTFQYGMRAIVSDLCRSDWSDLLEVSGERAVRVVRDILHRGGICRSYQQAMDAVWLSEAGHIIEWEGLKFLAKNTVERGSNMFLSKDVPETGHDALLVYGFRGKLWTISLYHAKHRTDLDLSRIAMKHGGGGHKGACGFTCKTLPFTL